MDAATGGKNAAGVPDRRRLAVSIAAFRQRPKAESATERRALELQEK
jgi:hypothetical protein